MLVATCPSREELLDYAVGKLSDEAAEALAGHLDTCPACEAQLAALPDADDSLVARLREPATSDPYLDESECAGPQSPRRGRFQFPLSIWKRVKGWERGKTPP